MSLFSYDQGYRKKGYRIIAGVDEAGRGCIAGPVVAGAVILRDNLRIEGLRDSKKLSGQQRKELFWKIMLEADDVGFGVIDVRDIERLNILEATKKAMLKALEMLKIRPQLIMIDAIRLDIPLKQISIIKGDDRSASIAAASVIAKVLRDWIMEYYDSIYPYYGFKKHRGYCTKEHLIQLKLYGPCPIHRKTFKHVMDLELPLDSIMR
jgi:ribonuclease HII